MSENIRTNEQDRADKIVSDAEAIATAFSATRPDQREQLRAISMAMMLGAQIAEQCAAHLGDAS